MLSPEFDVDFLYNTLVTTEPTNIAFTPAATVRSYALDADTVLFNRDDGQVIILNETAAFVWEALTQGLDCPEIAKDLSRRTGIDSDRVLHDCRSLVGQWTAAGLGTERSGAELVLEPEADRDPGLPAGGRSLADETALTNAWRDAKRKADERRCYRIADLRLILDAPAAAFVLIDGLLDHLRLLPAETLAGVDTNAATSVDEPVIVTIGSTDDGWVLYLEDMLLCRCNDDSKLAPMLHATVLHLSYAASRSRLAIHGAAVFSGNRCVLLPGQPQAGKSTLTAALVASGLGYCTDDFSLLDGGPLRLRGIPLCIGLKEGSWPLFETTNPAVDLLPTYVREDGQRVRYLPPPAACLAEPDDNFGVAAIVFPSLVESASCRLDPLPRSAALLKISDSGYHLIGNELDSRTLEATIAWLGTLQCYELTYWNLEDAVGKITQLLTQPGPATV